MNDLYIPPRPRKPLFPRVDLPPLDQFGPWPKRLVSSLVPPPPIDTPTHEAVDYYCEEAHKAWRVAAEERARRLSMEEELVVSNAAFLRRDPPTVEYVERKVYTPMPPKEVIKKFTIERGGADASVHRGDAGGDRQAGARHRHAVASHVLRPHRRSYRRLALPPALG